MTTRTDADTVPAAARGCTRCAGLAPTRTQVVCGAGDPDADLMFVGEAPGAREDEQDVPLTGAAGQLLDELLEGIGLRRGDVFVTNVLLCRPPGNRDPRDAEIANCRGWLEEAVARVRPLVVCPLGSFATKLLRSDPAPITTVHGRPEVCVIGARAVRLYPLFHPAAALYASELQDTLRADVARLPALLALDPPDQPEPEPEKPSAVPALPEPPADPMATKTEPEAGPPGDEQLGLF